MLLTLANGYQPPAPLEGPVYFRDDFRQRVLGNVVSGPEPADYARVMGEGFTGELYIQSDATPSPHFAARSNGGGFYSVQEAFISRRMRPARDVAVTVRFYNPYSISYGELQPGPSSPGYDSDPMLLLRWGDAANYVLLHAQRWTKRFMLYEVVGGVTYATDLGDILRPGYEWGTIPWQPTRFETLDPLLWEVQVIGRQLTGSIREALTGITLYTFSARLRRSSKGVVGFGSRRHYSGLAAWEWLEVQAFKPQGVLTVGGRRGLRRAVRGGEDGKQSRG